MDAEKEIIRDMWLYLKERNDPPVVDNPDCAAFWENAARDIGCLVGGKWKNHPLAMELGLAMYSYLEKKCKAKGGETT